MVAALKEHETLNKDDIKEIITKHKPGFYDDEEVKEDSVEDDE